MQCNNRSRRMSKPLLGSNLTTILGFTPILFIGGPTGEFMEQLGWSVIVCLLGSLLLSLTIIPVLAAWWLRPGSHARCGEHRVHTTIPAARRWLRATSTAGCFIRACDSLLLPVSFPSIVPIARLRGRRHPQGAVLSFGGARPLSLFGPTSDVGIGARKLSGWRSPLVSSS